MLFSFLCVLTVQCGSWKEGPAPPLPLILVKDILFNASSAKTPPTKVQGLDLPLLFSTFFSGVSQLSYFEF